MNDTFAAELERLWKAGAVDLPNGAIAFAQAAAEIHTTGTRETDAFARRAGGMGDLHGEWTKLRNTLQDNIFGPSHDNLLHAGETLARLADDYAAADDTARTSLDKYKANAQPPSRIPDAPKHTDAHPAETPQGPQDR